MEATHSNPFGAEFFCLSNSVAIRGQKQSDLEFPRQDAWRTRAASEAAKKREHLTLVSPLEHSSIPITDSFY